MTRATGAEGRAVRQLRVDERLNGLLLRTDRAVYRQGETANLVVHSASRARRVFVDAVRNGRTVTSTSIQLSDQTGSHAFDLPTDLAGSIQLQAYAILEDGEIVRDTKLIQVHRADQLQIEATLDAETYKPAEKALINFLVTSKNGDPVAAALSLAAVDEAVFALNDTRPGLEEMYFLVQEEILKPRYQFVTQPRSDFVTVQSERSNDGLEEANVIRFSAAEGTSEAAPDAATGSCVGRAAGTTARVTNRRLAVPNEPSGSSSVLVFRDRRDGVADLRRVSTSVQARSVGRSNERETVSAKHASLLLDARCGDCRTSGAGLHVSQNECRSVSRCLGRPHFQRFAESRELSG